MPAAPPKFNAVEFRGFKHIFGIYASRRTRGYPPGRLTRPDGRVMATLISHACMGSPWAGAAPQPPHRHWHLPTHRPCLPRHSVHHHNAHSRLRKKRGMAGQSCAWSRSGGCSTARPRSCAPIHSVACPVAQVASSRWGAILCRPSGTYAVGNGVTNLPVPASCQGAAACCHSWPLCVWRPRQATRAPWCLHYGGSEGLVIQSDVVALPCAWARDQAWSAGTPESDPCRF